MLEVISEDLFLIVEMVGPATSFYSIQNDPIPMILGYTSNLPPVWDPGILGRARTYWVINRGACSLVWG